MGIDLKKNIYIYKYFRNISCVLDKMEPIPSMDTRFILKISFLTIMNLLVYWLNPFPDKLFNYVL